MKYMMYGEEMILYSKSFINQRVLISEQFHNSLHYFIFSQV